MMDDLITYTLSHEKVSALSSAQIVLLDTSVWNRLADAKTENAIAVRDALLAQRAKGRVFCPLCEPVIWELRGQRGPSLFRAAELMEALSCNVSFRSIEQIYDSEVRHFLDYLLEGEFRPLSFVDRFGPLMSYHAPSFTPKHPAGEASRWDPEMINRLGSDLNELTVPNFVRYFQRLGAIQEIEVPDRRVVAQRRYALAKGAIAGARRIEAEYIARSALFPRIVDQISKLPSESRLIANMKLHGLLNNRKYKSSVEHILNFTPAMLASVEAQTLGGLDTNRATFENDFQDLTLIIYGLSYSNTLSAIDRWVASIIDMARQQRFPGFVRYAGSLEELGLALEDIGRDATPAEIVQTGA